MNNLLLDSLITGLPLVPLVLGIFMIFRVREDMDLTITGSFAAGGSVAAKLISDGHHWAVAMVAAMLIGLVAGGVTVLQHVLFGVPIILAGLVTALGVFTVNLRIMGMPALSLGDRATMFSSFDGYAPDVASWLTVACLAGVGLGAVVLVGTFLTTDLGLALRASGVSSQLVRAQAADESLLIGLNVMLANALCGLSGALLVQVQGFADVNMGSTLLVAGLGSLLLGELVATAGVGRQARHLASGLAAVLIGAVLYRIIVSGAIELGLDPKDLQLVTALILVAAFALTRLGAGRKQLDLVIRRKVRRTTDLSREKSLA